MSYSLQSKIIFGSKLKKIDYSRDHKVFSMMSKHIPFKVVLKLLYSALSIRF